MNGPRKHGRGRAPAASGRSAAGHAGKVRIIGGCWKGTRLQVADAPGLRPTSDRVRETVFNWLQPVLPGTRVLDLFAGSGALALEALSRGAREALLIEADPQTAACLQATIERLQADDRAHVLRADALALLRAPLHGRFDTVFLDPPFALAAWPFVLDALQPWLAAEAWVYLESAPDAKFDVPAGWHLHREGRTSHARHALYRVCGSGAAPETRR